MANKRFIRGFYLKYATGSNLIPEYLTGAKKGVFSPLPAFEAVLLHLKLRFRLGGIYKDHDLF